MNETTRREFLIFMAATGAVTLLPACASLSGPGLPFKPLKPTGKDDLVLAEGFSYDLLLRWKQPLTAAGAAFGFNNDYLAYFPLDKANPLDGLMWVNHEYTDPYYNSGWRMGQPRTRQQIDIERRDVGGSIVHIRKSGARWDLVKDSKYNRRIDGFTKIPLVAERAIAGSKTAVGTFAGCAGGVTPWGTVLSAEENFHYFVGDVKFENGKRIPIPADKYMGWFEHAADLPPEHYGWIVEVDPRTGAAKKLTGLGRFAHECATCTVAKDGRTVVYTGEDQEDEHLYKFIASTPGSLDKGELYVADIPNGRWLPLVWSRDPRLKKAFKDQTELLIRAPEAAKIVGATPLDRPEDIEIMPSSGAVLVALSLSKTRKNYFGSLLKIEEKNNDPLSLEFKASTFMAGGVDAGFACPDNMAFDRNGNLWLCSDIPAPGKDQWAPFANNGLFFIPLSGPHAGKALQVASAPGGAELTGPLFAPDGQTLFLSVQHPGEREFDKNHWPSSWPDGGTAEPAPCVVQIQGPMMEKLLKRG